MCLLLKATTRCSSIMEKRTRNWTFTLNNYTAEEEARFQSADWVKQISWFIYGHEEGEDAHTPHLQGTVVFFNAKTFTQVRSFFGERFHVEQRKGTLEQNIAYCSKEGKFIEYGTRPKQGSRTDIADVKKRILKGDPLGSIIMDAPSYQSARHAELLFKYQPMPPEQKRSIMWYYGSTGTGKTRLAVTESKGDYWIAQSSLKWWDGYVGQKYVILDDFRADFCTFHELLRITDRYPYRVQVKGASLWLQPSTTHIIFTSAYPPDKIYKTREDIGQLLRRIDSVKLFRDNATIEDIRPNDLLPKETIDDPEGVFKETPVNPPALCQEKIHPSLLS
nr:MAG: replication associated protein [Cressdnaviricota sp.]